MYSIILFIHYLVCALMVIVILLQSGKGGGLAGAFGGGGSTIFGGRGAGTVLTRATMVLGGMFFLTCLSLALMSSNAVTGGGKSILQEEARKATGTQPGGTTPAQRPQAPGALPAPSATTPIQPAPQGASPQGAAQQPAPAKAPAPGGAAGGK
jgi:preprotein translocase subunit SecG